MRADDFSGRVVGISDGDTISVMHDGRAEKIRLYGIDAPEKGQAFGNRAKQFVSALAFGKEVKVEVKDQDRYGRTVADVILPDGRNLNREIVKAGFAWWYRKYAPKDTELEALESEARQANADCGWILNRCRRGNYRRFDEAGAVPMKCVNCGKRYQENSHRSVAIAGIIGIKLVRSLRAASKRTMMKRLMHSPPKQKPRARL